MRDLDLLIQCAKDAGDIALQYWQTDFGIEHKPDGAGPVTEADLAVNTALFEGLCDQRPDYGWLSEETEDSSARLERDKVFVVDPIDGTRSFIAKEKSWAHSLAIVENGIVSHGVIYLPARDLLYSAELGGGAFLNGQPISISEPSDISHATVLGARPIEEPARWQGGIVPSFKRHYRPSLAYRIAAVAQGKFDAMLTLRPTWEWDICAGALIALEAGAKVSDARGHDLRFNSHHPQTKGILVAGPELHQQFLTALDF